MCGIIRYNRKRSPTHADREKLCETVNEFIRKTDAEYLGKIRAVNEKFDEFLGEGTGK